MQGYKEPGFQERQDAARKARDKALQKLRDKPPVDPEELARLTARRVEKEAAAAAKREAVRQARFAEQAERKARADQAAAEELAAAEEAAAAALAAMPKVMSDEEKKAARDARYAARKANKSTKKR